MAALGAGLLAPSAFAALSVYEPFNYIPSGSVLSTVGTGGTGFSSGWTTTGTSATINTTGLSYSLSPAVGLAGTTTTGTATVNSRSLTSALGANGTTTYFSFLLQPKATTAGQNAEFGLLGASSVNLWVGKSAAGTYTSTYVMETGASAGSGTSAVNSGVTVANGTTVLLVIKAVFNSGADNFSLFVNPTSFVEGTPSATLNGVIDLGTSFSSLQFTGNLGFTFDELKIGSAYADVVPEPGTWGSVFALAGIGCIAWLRNRSRIAARKAALPTPVPVPGL
jgi:hypothetical protein